MQSLHDYHKQKLKMYHQIVHFDVNVLCPDLWRRWLVCLACTQKGVGSNPRGCALSIFKCFVLLGQCLVRSLLLFLGMVIFVNHIALNGLDKQAIEEGETNDVIIYMLFC